MFIILKTNYFQLGFLYKIYSIISTARKHISELSELITFKPRKTTIYLAHHLSDKGFKGKSGIAIFALAGHLK